MDIINFDAVYRRFLVAPICIGVYMACTKAGLTEVLIPFFGLTLLNLWIWYMAGRNEALINYAVHWAVLILVFGYFSIIMMSPLHMIILTCGVVVCYGLYSGRTIL